MRHQSKRTRRRAAPRLRVGDAPLLAAVGAALSADMLFGGAPSGQGFALILIVAAGLAAGCVALATGAWRRASPGRAVAAFAVLAALLPVAQLLPLPPGVANGLPGHALAAESLAAVGRGGDWLPWSVAPLHTALIALLALPALGLFGGVLALSDDDVDLLLLGLAALVALSFAVGLVQVVTGAGALRFHRSDHNGFLLGFFANKNHSATLLASGIMLSAYLSHRWSRGRAAGAAAFAAAGLLLFAGILATNSRAGLALGGIALLASALTFVPLGGRERRWIAMAGVAALAAGFATLSLSGVAERSVDRYADVGADRRWTIWTDTAVAVRDYMPLGAGMGSFVDVYRSVEPLSSLNPRFANHAHNDYLELALEGGVPAALLVAFLLAIWAWRSWALLRRPGTQDGPDARRGAALLGSGIMLLVLLHSLVDYPLRTISLLGVFAVALALLVRAGRPAPAR